MCGGFCGLEMEDKLIYKTENFKLLVPKRPHIDRSEGGHIFIRQIDKAFNNRAELPPEEAVELARLTMLAGEAYQNAMNIRGIKVRRINYQDNGNWAYLRNEEPFMHVHLYGRTEYSNKQKWGEALVFPNPFTEYYDSIEPINAGDVEEIRKQINILESTEKYKIENWKLDK